MPRPCPDRTRALIAVLFTLLVTVAMPVEAYARSSGGYSRPSVSSRTPSFGGGSSSRGYRTPSTSGGYSRPSPSYAPPPMRSAPQSPGDRSMSQSRSGAAFDAYRQQQDNVRRPNFSPAPQQQYRPPQNQAQQYQAPRGYAQPQARSGWFNDRGFNAPAPGYFGGGRSFGVWDGLFLGAMLSNLGRAGSGSFFHNNQNDPGYLQWRAEADRQAKENAELRGQLAQLDRELAARNGEPKTPGALPPEVPAELAKAPADRTPSTGGGIGWVPVVVLIGGAGIGYLAWKRRSAKPGGSRVTPPADGILGSAGAMLKHKLSGEAYAPSKFRLGMTIALDPTPFILAGEAIKLQAPQGGQMSVSAIGTVTAGQTKLLRLYLPDEHSMVQLHLDAAGDPDECRVFSTIDEVTPADPAEWAAWLDPKDGMIGWPQFQTKDGRTYDRVWVPGATMVSPRVLSESIETLSGTRTVESRAMLYAAPTGAPDPAPAMEYVLVEARQDAGRAWVEVRAGIDINPVTLQLA